MRQHLAYREIQNLPLADRQAALRDTRFRQRILSEEKHLPKNKDAVWMMNDYDRIYVMDANLTYEPSAADSVNAVAQARGQDPLEVVMDTMANGIPLLVLFGGYPGDLEAQREMLANPLSVFGLSDGGAHCGVLVDASVPTYMLSYFTRDRERGPRLPLEFVVNKMTQDTAQVYGLYDRGVIAPGYRADLNLIDYAQLSLNPPEMVYDLPAQGKRLVQTANGYRTTICAGEVTFENGQYTGALPGKLLRGGQAAPNQI